MLNGQQKTSDYLQMVRPGNGMAKIGSKILTKDSTDTGGETLQGYFPLEGGKVTSVIPELERIQL
jgi:hypothetical protein